MDPIAGASIIGTVSTVLAAIGNTTGITTTSTPFPFIEIKMGSSVSWIFRGKTRSLTLFNSPSTAPPGFVADLNKFVNYLTPIHQL